VWIFAAKNPTWILMLNATLRVVLRKIINCPLNSDHETFTPKPSGPLATAPINTSQKTNKTQRERGACHDFS